MVRFASVGCVFLQVGAIPDDSSLLQYRKGRIQQVGATDEAVDCSSHKCQPPTTTTTTPTTMTIPAIGEKRVKKRPTPTPPTTLTCATHKCAKGKRIEQPQKKKCRGRCSDELCCKKEEKEKTCSDHECPSGYLMNQPEESCGKKCSNEQCCTKEESCSDHTCQSGYWMNQPEKSCGKECSDGKCCKKEESCLDHKCQSGYWMNQPEKSCGEECSDGKCCTKEESCSDHECSSGYWMNQPEKSCGQTCSDRKCCTKEKTCSDHECPSGYLMNQPEESCGQKCSDEKCCTKETSCSDHECPSGYLNQPEQSCGQTCSDEKCCTKEKTCSDHECPSGYLMNRPEESCGKKCSNKQCCTKEESCSDHECPSGYRNSKKSCGEEECSNGLCCIAMSNCPVPAKASICHYWGEPHFTHLFTHDQEQAQERHKHKEEVTRSNSRGQRMHTYPKVFEFHMSGVYRVAKQNGNEVQAFFCPGPELFDFKPTASATALAVRMADGSVATLLRPPSTKGNSKDPFSNRDEMTTTSNLVKISWKSGEAEAVVNRDWTDLGEDGWKFGDHIAGNVPASARGEPLGSASFISQLSATSLNENDGKYAVDPVCIGDNNGTFLVDYSVPVVHGRWPLVYETSVTVFAENPETDGSGTICGDRELQKAINKPRKGYFDKKTMEKYKVPGGEVLFSSKDMASLCDTCKMGNLTNGLCGSGFDKVKYEKLHEDFCTHKASEDDTQDFSIDKAKTACEALKDDGSWYEVCLVEQCASFGAGMALIDAEEAFSEWMEDAGIEPPTGPPTTTTTTTTTQDCADDWAQCGGHGWKGSTCCKSGSYCTGGKWYEQCKPRR